MATPAQMMQTVSAATGIPLATIVDIDRKLVTAGLRTKGGRGLHAALMTPHDAARLLTAVLASPQASEAAQAVERYVKTRVDMPRSSEALFAAVRLDDLAALSTRQGFVDAMAALIASASSGSLAKLAATSDDDKPSIEIFAFTRATRGRIRISGLPNGLTASVEYVSTGRARAASSDSVAGDLEQSRRITERTIFAVAELWKQENGRGRT